MKSIQPAYRHHDSLVSLSIYRFDAAKQISGFTHKPQVDSEMAAVD